MHTAFFLKEITSAFKKAIRVLHTGETSLRKRKRTKQIATMPYYLKSRQRRNAITGKQHLN
jgi:hypothetical protein